jgi:hypothetical protein
MHLFLAGLLLGGLALGAAGPAAAGPRESIEKLTQRLMTLNVERQRGDAAARARAAEAQLSAAVAREQRLAELIADQPGLVLRHALSAKLRAMLPAAVKAHVEEELTTEGELEVLYEDRPDGGRYHYFMDRPEGRVSLHFAADAPDLLTGDHVRVTGVRVRRAMALRPGAPGISLQAAAVPNTFGVQKTAVILVRFQDKPTLPGMTPAQAYEEIFATSNPRSTTNFFREASYGQAWLEGDVYGIYTIPVNSAGCDKTAIASHAKQAATAEVGATKMGTYRRFVYSFHGSGCDFMGLATLGGSPSQAWITGDPYTGILSHEMGHNFGLYHSHGLICDEGEASICSDGRENEYGDSFDAMGSGFGLHYNAVQKERLGWLNYSASPPVTTVTSSGTYAIDPYQTVGSNPKALKVRTPSGDWYYIEYRPALGFDASRLLYNDNVTNGALVHRWFGSNPDRINLIFMTVAPLDSRFPALEVGSSFSDPQSGITITPLWAEDTLGVSVSIGGGGSSCVRRDPTVNVSPAQQEGRAGTMVSYAVSVTNNDSGCAAATFTQQATAPTEWAAAFDAPTLSIAAGQSATTTLRVRSSTSARAGRYTITSKSVSAALPDSAASTAATYDVPQEGEAGTFTDDFDRPDSGSLANGWTSVSGSLGVSGNRAANTLGGALNAAIQAGVAGGTQIVAARFASDGNNSAPEFGLLARYKDAGNYYTCYRRTGGTSALRIAKVVGGVEKVLRQVSVPNPGKGVPFSLACQASGSTLTLTLNGVKKLTVSDSTFANGSVGLRMGHRTANAVAASGWADDFSAAVQ